jgi:tRNA(Ile)-lysidine synthase
VDAVPQKLPPAVAAIRTAVRPLLAEAGRTGTTVLVACSGGADSLALSATAHVVGRRLGAGVGLVTVDHGLQHGSAQRAQGVAEWARKEGLRPVIVETVDVRGRRGGPEASAREARYEALVRAATAHGIGTVLLGHTLEDQAETVLLAMVRGAGLRGLSAMPDRRTVGGVALVRPLLGISRIQTRTACSDLGLEPWEDPHNGDPAFTRTRARALLQSLVESLGPAVVANLARTARLAAADTRVLDDLAAAHVTGESLAVADLTELPEAIRTRVLHAWARSLGASGAALSHRHVEALDALVVRWRGQGPVHLPGGILVARRDGLLSPHAPDHPRSAPR